MITEEEREHVKSVVDAINAAEPTIEFGEREGPCVVEYRDWWSRGWPMCRGFSCLGCKYHLRDEKYRNSLCEHPDFVAKYGSIQSVAYNLWWRTEMAEVNAFSCPALRRLGVRAHCPAVPRDELFGRSPSNAYRRFFPDEEAEIFAIPQSLPYWLKEGGVD